MTPSKTHQMAGWCLRVGGGVALVLVAAGVGWLPDTLAQAALQHGVDALGTTLLVVGTMVGTRQVGRGAGAFAQAWRLGDPAPHPDALPASPLSPGREVGGEGVPPGSAA